MRARSETGTPRAQAKPRERRRVHARPMPRPEARSAVAPVVDQEPVPRAATETRLGTLRVNTFFLGTAMALSWAVIQLQSSLAAITTEQITGQTALAGLGPALFLLASGAATLPAGRLMDAWGRVPGLSLGFLVATIGAALLFTGTAFGIAGVFFAGMLALGAGLGAVQLARAGAADMYPPERRGRGIGLVLVGAAVGSVLSPVLFNPLLSGRGSDPASLSAPWLVAGTLTALGAGLVWMIRIDPLTMATANASERATPSDRPRSASGGRARPTRARRSLRSIYSATGPRAALVGGIAAQLVMTAAMALVPLQMRHAGHDLGTISLALGAHFLGMFGLSPVMGGVVDQIGLRRSLVGGLAVLGFAVLALALGDAPITLIPAMLCIGLGWNVAYVAATALIADGTEPDERGAALGAADLLALVAAAAGAVLSAALLGILGLPPVVALAALCAMIPAALLAGGGRTQHLPAGA